jgi:hypothetical protein
MIKVKVMVILMGVLNFFNLAMFSHNYYNQLPIPYREIQGHPKNKKKQKPVAT